MVNPKVSLFASAIRPGMWLEYFKSLESTSITWEVVFAGPVSYDKIPVELIPLITTGRFKLIETGPIKPSQCYEAARRACVGETISWSCDDASYDNDVLGKAYRHWKQSINKRLILSLQTKESGYHSDTSTLYDMSEHRFYGGHDKSAPLMAPMCLMSRQWLEELGGIDRRYVCGQYENDIVMRAYQQGGSVQIFGNKDCCIDIDHLRKSRAVGESVTKQEFLERPFAKGYGIDRNVLEGSWTILDEKKMFLRLEKGERPPTFRECVAIQQDSFEPFEEKDLLTRSQSNNLPEMWC